MNPLQEHPHLFATPEGVFKIKSFGEIKPFTYQSLPAIEYGEFDDNWSKCTLIARPIEDMSDEEREEYKKILELGQYHGNPEVWWNSAFKAKLYLLSIGVYPFDQTHFEDGTVIDTRTI